jgi:hypothetical protein
MRKICDRANAYLARRGNDMRLTWKKGRNEYGQPKFTLTMHDGGRHHLCGRVEFYPPENKWCWNAHGSDGACIASTGCNTEAEAKAACRAYVEEHYRRWMSTPRSSTGNKGFRPRSASRRNIREEL